MALECVAPEEIGEAHLEMGQKKKSSSVFFSGFVVVLLCVCVCDLHALEHQGRYVGALQVVLRKRKKAKCT